MEIDIHETYNILVEWARGEGPKYYTNLSDDYRTRTGQWPDPRGSWNNPLGEISKRVASMNAPPLTVLVFINGTNEPGGLFWESASNIPARPSNNEKRHDKVWEMVKEVKLFNWPDDLK